MYSMIYGRQNGITLCQKLEIELMKALEMDFTVITPKGYEIYKKGKLFEKIKHKKNNGKNILITDEHK